MSRRATWIAMWTMTVAILAGSAQAQSVTSPNERFVLSGVVYVEGGGGLAWLQEPTFTNNRVVTVRVGDRIGPYRLTKVLDDQVELEGPGGRVSVPLAGTGGAVSVAAVPANLQPPGPEPQRVIEEVPVVTIPRGDPRRNFPASMVMIGAGAAVSKNSARQAPQALPVTQAPDVGRVPASMQTPPPELPPHRALNNPDATVVPRGDPRRNFPASMILVGAGAQTGVGR